MQFKPDFNERELKVDGNNTLNHLNSETRGSKINQIKLQFPQTELCANTVNKCI